MPSDLSLSAVKRFPAVHFEHKGELVEVSVILAPTKRDWDATPESRLPEWATQAKGDTILAVRLFG